MAYCVLILNYFPLINLFNFLVRDSLGKGSLSFASIFSRSLEPFRRKASLELLRTPDRSLPFKGLFNNYATLNLGF